MEKIIFNLFNENGKKIFLIGGSVRDRLLGKETNDLDFATDATPPEIKLILKNAGFQTYEVGIAFGTITTTINGNKIEITTFRRNESYTRNNRHPVVEWGNSIEEDLARRDFRINCIAQDSNGNIIDPYKGISDLKNGIIDTPIEPEKSFSDDSLRLLRAVRLRARLGFKYSERVKKALLSESHRLLYLPKERILEEFNKILLSDNVEEALNDLRAYKLLNYFIPELTILNNVEQNSKYHSKNVWLHTCEVVSHTPKDLVLRWSSLLHDLGKFATRTEDEKGLHFYHHEEVSTLLAKSILYRLGLPYKIIDEVLFLISNHMKCNLYSRDWKDSAVRRLVNDLGLGLDKFLILSECDITSHREERVKLHLEDLADLKRRIEGLRNFVEIKSPLNGEEIMFLFNLPPCRKIKEIKDLLINALIEGKLNLNEDKQAYINYIKNNYGVV